MSGTCVSCGLAPESRSPLFFDRSFTKIVWNNFLCLAGVHGVIVVWNTGLDWAVMYLKGNSFAEKLLKSGLNDVMCFTWREREECNYP